MAAKFRKTFRPQLLSKGSESEIREEIDHYIELRAKELEAQGLSPEDARQAALDAFGDPEAVASSVRRQDRKWASKNGWRETMGSLRQDFQQALRGFRRNPAFALVASLTLAIGIGANTAIFSVVDAALIRGLPFQDSDHLIFTARFSSRLLDAFLFEVEATDPATFGVVVALLMAVSLIATAVPAYRASHRDPNDVLNGA